ncbi:hypothetical protein BV378_21640 [Nostoc sp. RF31YmG]|nr:hypothetical protein BV378_21640 [Nostoc sp. RF31YmG]
MFLSEKNNAISNFASRKDLELSRRSSPEARLLRLKSIVSYFSYLNKNGEISDRAFEALVHYACSIFIENELEARVQTVVEQKIIDFWESKLSFAIEKYLTNK